VSAFVLARVPASLLCLIVLASSVPGAGRFRSFEMFAIVQAGGRQEKVTPGTVVIIDRVDVEPGTEFTFDKVLLVENDGGDIVAGRPYVDGAVVTGVVEAQTQAKKIRVFKMKRRKQYRKTIGHRTQQTRVRVTDIRL
jgi:large subunit ribosomal protein L21